MVSVGAASMNIGPRMQGFRYLHGRITSSLEIGTLIQSIADFSPRCIIKQLKTHSNAIHSKNYWETQTLLKQILVHYHKQWPASMSYISHSHPWIEGLQSSLRSVKSCHHISQLSHHNCNNTDHRIIWIRRSQFHLSYVKNVSDTMACLKTTFLMWYQAICGECCSYCQLPTHLTRLGRHRWTPCFVLMGPIDV